MAKRKKQPNIIKLLLGAFFLFVSLAGSIMFGFGLKDYVTDRYSSGVTVVAGGVLMLLTIIAGVYTTETAFAMRKKK